MAGEGKIWFSTKNWKSDFDKIQEPLYIKEIHFGNGGSTYFRGSISELNLFSKTFTTEDLVTMTKGCKKIEENANNNVIFEFKWSEVKSSQIVIPPALNGMIEIKEENAKDICSTLSSTKIMEYFPWILTMEKAANMCDAWGGKIYLPESVKEIGKSEKYGWVDLIFEYLRAFC